MTSYDSRTLNVKSRWEFLSLRSTMLIGFGLTFSLLLGFLFLALTFGIPGSDYKGVYGIQRCHIKHHVSVVADLEKERLESWLRERKNDLETLSRVAAFDASLTQVRRDSESVNPLDSMKAERDGRSGNLSTFAVKHILNSFESAFNAYARIDIVEGVSAKTVASTKADRVGAKTEDQLLLAETLTRPGQTLTDVRIDEDTGRPFLILAKSIPRAAGAPNAKTVPGSVFLYIDTDEFIRPMLHLGEGFGKSEDVVLVNQDNLLLVTPKYPLPGGQKARVLKDKVFAKPAALAAQGQEGVVAANDYRGVPVLAAYRHIDIGPSAGWGLVVKLDENEVLRPIWEGLGHSLLLTLIAFVAGTFLIALVSKRISQPISSMSLMAGEVQRGNLDVRALVTGPKELRILAETGNAMLDQMCGWGRDLEDQVRERTSELSKTNSTLEAEIAERNQAEQALRESEERYRTLFESAADGIFIIEAEPGNCGAIISANQAAAQMHGYSLEELLRLRMQDLSAPRFAHRVSGRIAEITPGERIREETSHLKKDGAEVFVEITASKLEISAHRYVMAICRDVTGRREAEQAQMKLTKAVEHAGEAIIITDTGGAIEYVNPAFELITGYSRAEAIGQPVAILKSGEHSEDFYRKLWDTIRSGEVWTGRIINRKKDGTIYQEDATISPVRNSAGQILNYVAVKKDITLQVSLQNQLFRAQKMEAIGALAGGVAHDFNNLLTIVLGYAQMILLDKPEQHPDHEPLQQIISAVHSGTELARRLLTFGRKTETKPQPVDLNREVHRMRRLLNRTFPKSIKIELQLTEDPVSILADPAQIEQVMINLAVNARDAMPEGGSLVIETKLLHLDQEYAKRHFGANPGHYALLSFSDDGHGMDKETLEHIYEPFFTTKPAGQGTGLGLAMVYGIVRKHNGYISCYSSPGRGTTFKIYIPLIYSDVIPDTMASVPLPRGGTETILLVDDEESVINLGSRILSLAGYKVLTASNGEEALEVYKTHKSEIAMVALDLIMPGMSGVQCLEELLKLDPKVKALIASGYAANGQAKNAIRAGAKGFVTKPFELRQILYAIREILDAE
jgi:PAS domain S-box-containing protein